MNTPENDATPGLQPGLEGRAAVLVTDAMTAPALGSGTVPVYASPAVAALMEAAAIDCVEKRLRPGDASLGVHLDMHHKAPTLPGATVHAKATLIALDGRKLTFAIEAHEGATLLAEARHTRVIVNAERFMARLTTNTPDK